MTTYVAGAPREERPRELQDPLNLHFYHPLAARLARLLAPTGISPNIVSVGSAVALVLATWAFVSMPWPLNALTGFAFMISWHIVDGADGDLARMTGKSSATGELVDGVCDYFGNVVMYFAFAFWLDDTLGGWAWAFTAGAGASHILQTNHAETQRRLYAWRVYGRSWLRSAVESGDDVVRKTNWFTRYFGFWAQGYVWLSDRMSPSANPVDEALATADPDKAARIRARIRAHSGTSLALEKALGANPKTFLIAASIALGGPVYYFLAMLTAMNLILIVSIVHHKWMERRFAAMISAL
jgi:phosphatidylglycerophosphate synthase